MRDDAHLLGKYTDNGTVEFVIGGMVPSYPFDKDGDGITIKIYDQSGDLCNLRVADAKDSQMFGVWLRKYDRYKGAGHA